MVKLSFCTTCMNRLFQLQDTLPHNLAVIEKFEGVNLSLVNYNSQDGLHEYIISHFQKYIEQGILRYFYTKEPKYFHCAIAKNLAHRVGNGDIVYNLDGDNFITEINIQNILDAFDDNQNIFLHETTDDKLFPKHVGTYGRIASKKSDFLKISGYDEGLLGSDKEDNDIIKRFKKMGLKKINSNYNITSAIPNDKSATIVNLRYKCPYFLYRDVNTVLLFLRNLFRRPINPNGMKKFNGQLNLQKNVFL